MIFKIFFWLAIGLELVCLPVYAKLQYPRKTKASLLAKMACSSLFVIVALLSMVIAGNRSRYAILMVSALIAALIGDFFLHVKETVKLRIIGICAFTACHVLIITNMFVLWHSLNPDKSIISITMIIVAIIMAATVLTYGLIKKWPVYTIVPFSVYAVFLSFMLTSVVRFGIYVVKADWKYSILLACILIIGAVFFVASDTTLSFIYTDKKAHRNFPLKVFNIFTYFIAQILFASSILFINY